LRADAQTAAELTGIFGQFCEAIERRNAEAIIDFFAPDPDPIVVTSEEALLRGDDWKDFVHRYVLGPTTYSWTWKRYDVSIAGDVGWLLAVGTETETSAHGQREHPYRMTAVFEKRNNRWLLAQLHGSSPHQ
jgi:ketosteroid isomerase-like protein